MGMNQGGELNPSIRASDEDRDRVVEILRQHTAEGRITAEEFDERMTAAYSAKTLGALAELTADLPVDLAEHARRQQDLARLARQRGRLPKQVRQELAGLGSLAVVLTTIWVISGAGYFWPVWPLGIIAAITVARLIQAWGER
ncbi:DUF1707 SHOCT-like domain-containing protein [Actinospica acidithermotolerans]|uniref:DUF1707 SHOCT-like domain-containing protein n=1 Tax=Actinospica acidithermotolerans TaxID=2828514 RepID=UPI0020118FA7|nr:DUF1707 domain-containing protein [Actinospica acidithermotolerans]